MLLSTQVEFQSLRRLPAQTKHEFSLQTGGANVTQSCALYTAHTHTHRHGHITHLLGLYHS